MIKKITQQELEALNTAPLGKRHPVRAALETLKVDEILHIPRASFTWKRQTPQRLCNEITKKTKQVFAVSVLLDNSGWVVKRES